MGRTRGLAELKDGGSTNPLMDKRVVEVCMNCPRKSGRCSNTGCPAWRKVLREVTEEMIETGVLNRVSRYIS